MHHGSMHLTEEAQPTSDVEELCGTPVGKGGHHTCRRDADHRGPHAHWYGERDNYEYTFLYGRDDPTEFVHDHCKVCFDPLTDDNRAEGPGKTDYCSEHIGAFQEKYWARNGCKECGHRGGLVLRNYDPMWQDGDLHCEACGAYVRMFDAG